MKFDYLILKKIFRFVAARFQILRLQCTKFNFGWGSAPDPTVGAYRAPADILARFQGPLLREGSERVDIKRVGGDRSVNEREWRRRGPQGLIHTPYPNSEILNTTLIAELI